MLILSDKLREECGVVAIYGHPEASKLAYLSLYALQHRGQESAGIAASNRKVSYKYVEYGTDRENPVCRATTSCASELSAPELRPYHARVYRDLHADPEHNVQFVGIVDT